MSTFTSPQPVAKASAKKNGHFLDFCNDINQSSQLHFQRGGPLTLIDPF
jgi:hypothetical protein